MLDEVQRLRECPSLFQLLMHYAQVGAADREAWQDRLMQLDQVQAKELVQLHGELIAYSWITQNTGNTPVLKPGVVACCYRITSEGLRALKRAQRQYDADEDEEAAAA